MIDFLILFTGYLASALLAVSLLVNNDLKFRWINTWGCLAFITYGILIHAFPIIVTNAILLLINGFNLVKIYRRNENFDLVEFTPDDKLIHKFMDFYKKDINSYFPQYDPNTVENSINFVVLRDMAIANVFVATVMDDGTALVKLNYTVHKYRDYKVGKFLFQKEKQLLVSRGINRLVYTSVFNKQHEKYLLKIGFEKEILEGQAYFHKSIL